LSRPVYSTNIFAALSVSGIGLIGAVPDSETWVVRFYAATFGDYVGYVRAALGVSETGPWLWLASSRQTALIGVSKQTFYWEGRMVVNPGAGLYYNIDNPDTCDLYVSGYVLTAS
jgi:hypothetical protein